MREREHERERQRQCCELVKFESQDGGLISCVHCSSVQTIIFKVGLDRVCVRERETERDRERVRERENPIAGRQNET